MSIFKGAYKLIEKHSIRTDGTKVFPWGQNVNGLLIYTDTHVSAQLGVTDRNKLSTYNFRDVKEDEALYAFITYIAYFGEYQVRDGYIIHKIKQSLFPNWIGQKVKRHYKFDGDLLYLEAKEIPALTGLEKTVLIWEQLQMARSGGNF